MLSDLDEMPWLKRIETGISPFKMSFPPIIENYLDEMPWLKRIETYIFADSYATMRYWYLDEMPWLKRIETIIHL